MTVNIIPDNQDIRVCLIGELDSTATTEQAGELKRASETQGGTIRVTHLNEDVADIFRMSGFQNIFDIV